MTCRGNHGGDPGQMQGFFAWVLQFGRVKRIRKLSGRRISRRTPAALPSFGQIAPKIQADAGRWSCGAGGPAGSGAAAAPGPLPGDLVVLANAGRIGNPHFHPVGGDGFCGATDSNRAGKVFFRILDRACRLRLVTQTGRELAPADAAQVPAQALPGDSALELRETPRAETCDPPAQHAMKVRCRSLLNPLRQRQAGPVIKDRHRPDPASRRALRLIRSTGPEAQNRSTGSRATRKLTPPVRAAAPRVAPS